MLSRYGTRSPSYEEAKAKTLYDTEDLNDTPVFGQVYQYEILENNRLSYEITVTGLQAQSNYTMHFVVVNLGGKQAEELPMISFATNDRFRTATFNAKFNPGINEETLNRYFEQVSQQLRIPTARIELRTDYSGSTGSPAPDND